MSDEPAALQRWHAVVESKARPLDELLADDVVFRSRAAFALREGRALTNSYLIEVVRILGPTMRYTGQWHDQASAMLAACSAWSGPAGGLADHAGRLIR
jgi:hypothetical protein